MSEKKCPMDLDTTIVEINLAMGDIDYLVKQQEIHKMIEEIEIDHLLMSEANKNSNRFIKNDLLT